MNPNRPVAMMSDEDLFDDVLKLAAAAGGELERVPDQAAVRLCWDSAPLILLDGDAARRCAEAGLRRRDAVLVVSATAPAAPVWEWAVALGARRVIELPKHESELVAELGDAMESPPDAAGAVLAVLGGRGGAGASVFAAAVGLAATDRGRGALLIDCDPLSGGLDLVLGVETEDGLRWPDMRLRSGRVASSSLHAALPGRRGRGGRVTVLSGARRGTGPTADAVAAVAEAGRRAGDTVVCDVPRDPDEAGYAALERADLTVIVVPGEVRACMAARLVARRLGERGIAARLVVRGPAPGGLRADDIADAVDLPLVASMRPEPYLAQSLERGEFAPSARGPLLRAARRTLDVLAAPQAARPVRASA